MKLKLYHTLNALFFISLLIGFSYSAVAQVTSYPYTEDFENFSVGTDFINDWTTSSTSTSFFPYSWQVNQGSTNSFSTGPEIDHTTGDASGKYVYTEATNGSFSDTARLISPVFDFTGMTNPTVTFYTHMFGFGITSLQLDVFDGTTWEEEVLLINGPQQFFSSDDWLEFETILSDYAGLTNVQFRFTVGRGFSGTADIAIDDVLVYDKPNFDLSIVAMNSPSADIPQTAGLPITYTLKNLGIATIDFTTTPLLLDVTISGAETGFESISRTFGTLLPGETLELVVNPNYVFNQLGQYDFDAVITLTGDEESSNNTLSTSRQSTPLITSFPYTESFESGAANWESSAGSSWEIGIPNNAHINAANDGLNAWVTNLTDTHNFNEISYVESPFFDLSSVVDPFIQLDVIAELGSSSGAQLLMSTDFGVTWTVVGSTFTGNNWYNSFTPLPTNRSWGQTFDWQRAEHPLDGITQFVKFRIYFENDDDANAALGNDLTEGFAFDNIFLGEHPAEDIGITAYQSTTQVPQGGFNPRINMTNFGSADQTGFDLFYSIDGGPATFLETVTSTVSADFQSLSYTTTNQINIPNTGTYQLQVWTSLSGDTQAENDSVSTTIEVLNSIASFPYLADFESGAADWFIGGTNASFELGKPEGEFINSAINGQQAWVTNLDGKHNASEISYVESPFFVIDTDAIQEPYLRFDYSHEMYEQFDAFFTNSIAYVQYSSDGEIWQPLGSTGEGINWYSVSYSEEGWTGKNEWRKAYFPLKDYLFNNTIKLRIRFESFDPLDTLEGFAFDNVQIIDMQDISDAGIVELTSPTIIPAGQPYSPTIRLAHVGTGSLPTIINTISYQIDGGTIQDAGIDGGLLSINSGNDNFPYQFLNSINLSTLGEHELKIFIDNNSGNIEALSDTLTCTIKVVPEDKISATTTYTEDFEGDDGGWCPDGLNSSWEHGQPNGFSLTAAAGGDNAWVTNLTGTMNNGEISYLYSPVFDFSGASLPNISFDYFVNTSFFDGSFPSFNYISFLEASTDGGDSWSIVGSQEENWYNIDPDISTTPTFGAGWGGNTNLNWQSMLYELGSFAGEESVQFRFTVIANSTPFSEDDGFGLDNVIIQEAEANDVGVTALVSATETIQGEYEVSLLLRNFGLTSQTSFNVAYQVGNGPIVSETFSAASAPLSSTDEATYTFTTKANLATAGSQTIKLFTQLGSDTNNSNDTTTASLTVIPIISSFPYQEDFENEHHWRSEGTNNSWQLGTPSVQSFFGGTSDGSANAWVTDTVNNYNSNELSYVNSPYFQFSSVSDLYWEFDLSYSIIFSDGAVLEYSLDTGQTWAVMDITDDPTGTKNWYTNLSAGIYSRSWGNSSIDWSTARVNLPSSFNNNTSNIVRFRIGFYSNFFLQEDGIAFDNVTIAEIPNDDIGITNYLSDNIANQAIVPVSLEIENLGFSDQNSIPIGYAINGVHQSSTSIPLGEALIRGDLDTLSLNLDLSGQAPGYQEVTFYTELASDLTPTNDTFQVTILVQPLITTYPYVEGFATDGGYWTASSDNTFEFGIPIGDHIDAAYEGDTAWVTNLEGDLRISSAYVMSPEFDFSSLTHPFTYFYYKSEQPSSSTQLEYSLDSGQTWMLIGDTLSESNWYTTTSALGSAWQTTTDDWLRAFHPLAELAGEQSVRLRFSVEQGGFLNEEGFAFDLITVGDAGDTDAGVHLIENLLEIPQNVSLTPTLSITNYGKNDLTALDVIFEADGQMGTNTSLGMFSSFNDTPYTEQVEVSVAFPNTGTYPYKAYTSLTGDTDAANDTIYGELKVIPTVNDFPHNTSFEGTDDDWTTSGINAWARGIPEDNIINSAPDGDEAWLVGADEEGTAYLTSPYFNFTDFEFPVVSFQLYLNGSTIASEGPSAFGEYLYMEYTTDFGNSWNLLGTTADDWYNITELNFLNPTNFDIWADENNGWQNMRQDLSFLGGESAVRFRLAYVSNASGFSFGFDRVAAVAIDGEDETSSSAGFGFDAFRISDENPLAVTNFNDSGAGSLRAAIEFANSNTGNDSIRFEVAGDTIFLASNITVSDSLILDLAGTDIIIKADDSFSGSEVFTIAASAISFYDFLLDVNTVDHGIFINNNVENINLSLLTIINADIAGINCDETSPTARKVLIEECNIYDCGVAGIVACDSYTISNNRIGTDFFGVSARGGQAFGIYLLGDSSIVTGNIISANDSIGLVVAGDANEIYFNGIGTDSTGQVALGNGHVGVRIEGNANQLGKLDNQQFNVIAGNLVTQVILSGGTDNTVRNNFIGIAGFNDEVIPLPGSGYGIDIMDGASDTVEFNTIQRQPLGGIRISGSGTDNNILYRNQLSANGGGFNGILIEDNAQESVTAPIIDSLNIHTGFIYGRSAPNTFVHVYADTLGEGALFINDTLSDATGQWVIHAPALDTLSDFFQTVTAIQDSAGNSSEFSELLALYPTLVTNTNEAGIGSLPYALNYANNHAGSDTILFDSDLKGSVFMLSGSLPSITDANTFIVGDIDGDFLPDIELDGSNNGGTGLHITGDSAIIYGLSITNYNTGIDIESGSRNLVLRSFIGVDLTGLTPKPNGFGIQIRDAAFHNTIGGDSPDWQNVISGNSQSGISINSSDSTFVIGNLIGLGLDGDTPLANADDGIVVSFSSNTLIGTSENAATSVISGNGKHGIHINESETSIILGNYLGTDSTGTQARGNTGSGIFVENFSQYIFIGNGTYEGRNVISDNEEHGIHFSGGSSFIDTVLIAGNFIGLDVTGLKPLGNEQNGIQLSQTKRVFLGHDEQTLDRNIISANGINGIQLSETEDINVFNNYIGTDSTGLNPLGNTQNGVVVDQSSSNIHVGSGEVDGSNKIAFNTDQGIIVSGINTGGVTINQNEIYSNTIKGISLVDDGNGNISPPNILAILPDGTVYGTADPLATIQLFADSVAQGRQYIEEGTADENGLWAIDASSVTLFDGLVNLTATQTITDSTSEFSNPFPISNILANYLVITAQDSVPGSLRAAIDYSNEHTGADTINFLSSLDGETLLLLDDLAPLNDPTGGTYINADLDDDCSPNITLDAEIADYGFQIESSENTVRGFAIIKAAKDGVLITGTTATDNQLQCNHIGIGTTGATTIGNVENGLHLANGAHENTIGGIASNRNIISGNAGNGILVEGVNTDNNLIINNYIGTDITGLLAIPNDGSGISILAGASNNQIGNGTDASRNVITSNQENGISIAGATSSANVIRGNYIGVDANCANALGNGLNGIFVDEDVELTRIGDLTLEGRNVIGGCSENGISISGTRTSIFGNWIGADTVNGGTFGNDQAGILLKLNARNDSIIGNVIAHNAEAVRIDGSGSFLNMIFNNAMFSNTAAIVLSNDAQQQIAPPVIDRVVSGGIVQGTASPEDPVHLYGGVDEINGKYLVSSTTADTDGNWEITVDYANIPTEVLFFLALQDSAANTSAFSNAVDIVDPRFVTNTNDDGIGSLRHALNNVESGDTIRFLLDFPTSIAVTSAPLNMSSLSNVVIEGPGADSLTISGNNSQQLFAFSSASGIQMSDVTLANGFSSTGEGGAINLSFGNSLTLEYCRIENNTAGSGGGIFVGGGSQLTARFCSFNGNTANFSGGAMSINGTVLLDNSTIHNNTSAGNGGGMYLENADGSPFLRIINSTISGNSANGNGGAIYAGENAIVVTQSVTVTQNIADVDEDGNGNGGGFFRESFSSNFELINTLIAQNEDFSSSTVHNDLSGTFDALSANLIGELDGATLSSTNSNNQIGSTASPIDPQLGDLDDNGGFTLTHLPLPLSAAIDAGDENNIPEFDQRGEGFPRIFGLNNDIGAIEGIGGTTEVTSIHNLGRGSLLEAISIANLQEGLDTITFNISGTGPHLIVLDSADLPAITDSLIIDGYTQLGADTATATSEAILQIEIRGTSEVSDLFVIQHEAVTIRGLALNSSDSCAILVDNVRNTTITGNWIGFDVDGNNLNTSTSNRTAGVCLSGQNAALNQIGGNSVGDRNVIGNWDIGIHITDTAQDNLVIGNYIGLAPNGINRAANEQGITIDQVAGFTTIGGTGDSLNYITGNTAANISLSDGNQNRIEGNRIGLNVNDDAFGTSTTVGIEVNGSALNQFILSNVIAGHGTAIHLNATNSGGSNTISNNLIGTDPTGLLARPNTDGIIINSNGSSITDNLIANSNFGIVINNQNASQNTATRNDYRTISGLAISLTGTTTPLANDVDDVDTAPANLGQNYPEICASDAGTDSVLIEGTLNSTGNSDYLIELFVNDSEVQGAGGTSLVDTIRVSIPTGSTSASFSHLLTGVDSSQFFSAAATNRGTRTTSEMSTTATVVGASFVETVLFGDSVFFDFNGFGNIVQYQWDFDGDDVDDLVTTLPVDPSFVYDNVGNHDVRLIVTPIAGCPQTFIKRITSTTPFLNPLDSAALAAVYTFDKTENGGTTGIPWDLTDRTFTWDGVAIRAGWATGVGLSGYEVAHLLGDTLVNLGNRQLDSLNLSDNALDFGDLVPFVSQFDQASKFTYSSQAVLTDDRTEFILVGQAFSIDDVPETHPNDQYQWLKTGNILAGETNQNFNISSTVAADTGVYVNELRNNGAPDLVLRSGEVTLVLGRAMKLTDSLALMALYDAVDGDNVPALSDGWQGLAQNWTGIVTRPDGQDSSRIVSIILNDLELTGQLPSELFDLEFIERLDLFNNNFSGSIPDNIGNATSLTYLDLDNNQLTGAVPSSIGNLVNLTTLWLARNQLTSVPPEIGRLSSLENLFLQVNLLTAIPDSINNLGKLEVLNISDNELTSLSRLDGLVSLQNLRLRGNQLTNFASVNGLNAMNLKSLDLSSNELDTLPELTAIAFPNLINVKVDLNRLDFADIAALPFEDNTGYEVFYTPQKQQLPFMETLVLQNNSFSLNALTSVDLFPGVPLSNHQFQWFKDNVMIVGATDPNYTISSMSVTDTGTYYCEVTSDDMPLLRVLGNDTRLGLDCSATTTAVTISSNSTTQVCEGATINLLLGVDQDIDYRYQWYRDDVVISGAIGKLYAPDQIDRYKVLVTDQDGCQAFSNDIQLSVLPNPTVSISLSDQVELDATILTNATDDGTFQWYLNGDFIPNANDSSYTALAAGEYTVSYTNENGCTGFATSGSQVTGLEDELFSKSIRLFPNPSKGTFNLQFAETISGTVRVNVYTITGVFVQTQTARHPNQIKVDLTNASSGVYFVEIITDKARGMKRVSKQ